MQNLKFLLAWLLFFQHYLSKIVIFSVWLFLGLFVMLSLNVNNDKWFWLSNETNGKEVIGFVFDVCFLLKLIFLNKIIFFSFDRVKHLFRKLICFFHLIFLMTSLFGFQCDERSYWF